MDNALRADGAREPVPCQPRPVSPRDKVTDEDPVYEASRIATDGTEKRLRRIFAAALEAKEDEATTAITCRTSETRIQHNYVFGPLKGLYVPSCRRPLFSAIGWAYSPGLSKNSPPGRPKAQRMASILQARKGSAAPSKLCSAASRFGAGEHSLRQMPQGVRLHQRSRRDGHLGMRNPQLGQ